jgi:hypothetical protein
MMHRAGNVEIEVCDVRGRPSTLLVHLLGRCIDYKLPSGFPAGRLMSVSPSDEGGPVYLRLNQAA